MNLEEAKAEISNIIHRAAEGAFHSEESQRIKSAVSDLYFHARHEDRLHIQELERYLKMFDSPQKALHVGYDQIRVRVISELDKIGRGRSQR